MNLQYFKRKFLDAIKLMKSWKAIGSEKIYVEKLGALGEFDVEVITQLLNARKNTAILLLGN